MNLHDKKGRHAKLHRHLDELVACFLVETGLMPSTVTLMEFMEWSGKMLQDPTCAARADAEEESS